MKMKKLLLIIAAMIMSAAAMSAQNADAILGIFLSENGDLTLRGYVGAPAFGRNSFWTRVK